MDILRAGLLVVSALGFMGASSCDDKLHAIKFPNPVILIPGETKVLPVDREHGTLTLSDSNGEPIDLTATIVGDGVRLVAGPAAPEQRIGWTVHKQREGAIPASGLLDVRVQPFRIEMEIEEPVVLDEDGSERIVDVVVTGAGPIPSGIQLEIAPFQGVGACFLPDCTATVALGELPRTLQLSLRMTGASPTTGQGAALYAYLDRENPIVDRRILVAAPAQPEISVEIDPWEVFRRQRAHVQLTVHNPDIARELTFSVPYVDYTVTVHSIEPEVLSLPPGGTGRFDVVVEWTGPGDPGHLALLRVAAAHGSVAVEKEMHLRLGASGPDLGIEVGPETLRLPTMMAREVTVTVQSFGGLSGKVSIDAEDVPEHVWLFEPEAPVVVDLAADAAVEQTFRIYADEAIPKAFDLTFVARFLDLERRVVMRVEPQ